MIYMCKVQKKSMSQGTLMGFDNSVDSSQHVLRQLIIAFLRNIHPFFVENHLQLFQITLLDLPDVLNMSQQWMREFNVTFA